MTREATILVLLLFAATSVAGCAADREGEGLDTSATSATAAALDENPFGSGTAMFYGTIPCASCPGIEMTLQLKPDRTFLLKSVYLEAENGEDRALTDLGRWSTTLDDSKLILRGGTEGTRRFHVAGVDTLEMLDNLGEPIESDLPYNLARVQNEMPLSEPVRMTGMYQYMADAAMFYECRTRMRYPVVFEEDHIEIERAYLAGNVEPGQEMFASFTGRIETRPRVDGGGEREFVVVSDFDEMVPGGTCHEVNLPLEGTIWNLIELNGHGIPTTDPVRIPHLVLIAEDSTAAGSGGCNRFTGSYRIDGDSLVIGKVASTMMACSDMMDVESEFYETLDQASTFERYGNMLELHSNGRFLARFEGRPASE